MLLLYFCFLPFSLCFTLSLSLFLSLSLSLQQSYINWVCMTQLKVYRNNSMSSISNHSADIIDGDDGLQYEHVKPCYGVCTQVLSHCPYYLPSSYQHDRDGETMEYVYGGYPAFACPGSGMYLLLLFFAVKIIIIKMSGWLYLLFTIVIVYCFCLHRYRKSQLCV